MTNTAELGRYSEKRRPHACSAVSFRGYNLICLEGKHD